MQSKYVFPSLVEWSKEDKVFDISFPDLEECFTFGENEEDVFKSAKEVLELCLYYREEKNIPIPNPSRIDEIKLNEGQFIILVEVWMLPVRDKFNNKSIKKTVTIPKWLNDIAVDNDINFSQVLQASLKKYLGI